jgi:uncharacterized protein with von Willebrand factor type A (vWA) domain
VVFLDFFYHLRASGLRVGTTEWLTLLDALYRGHARTNVETFRTVARAVLVHREADLDRFERAFDEFFRDLEKHFEVDDELLAWLAEAKPPRELTDEERAALEAMDLDEVRRRYAERRREQQERHDGGNRWIGTGGTSPFGNAGTNPAGVRVGGGSGQRSAIGVASQRRFQNLRHDRVLDYRQIGLALRRLRVLARHDSPEELDLEATVDETARYLGDIELVFRPERRNRVRLLLLVDVGGSMDPWAKLTEELFTAAHRASHFRSFRALFFHNAPYATLWRDIEAFDGIPTTEVLEQIDREWVLMFVGDAYMHPWELTQPGGSLYGRSNERDSGLTWLGRFAERCPRRVWLNPEPERIWDAPSIRLVRSVFPMYPMTLEGLGEAVDALRGARAPRPLVPSPIG